MGEIEPEPPGLNQRTLLRHVKPKHLAQRLVQEVGGRVVGARRGAACMIDLEIDDLADLQRAGFKRAGMEKQAMQLLLRVLDLKTRA